MLLHPRSPYGRTLIIACAVACLIVGQVYGQGTDGARLRLVSTWNEIEYEFPSPAERQNALIQGKYVSGAGVPIEVDVDYRSRGQSKIFVTVPRLTPGVPITLGVLNGQRGSGGPVISAYPDYSWQSSHGKSCDGITSVFRVSIDECKRLWVLDTGRVGDEQLCRPQLLTFDMRTDRLIHRYKFPLTQVRNGNSLLVTPVVDVRDPDPQGRCENTKVYIADVSGFGFLVYDLRSGRSWRAQNKLAYPTPLYGTFNVAGETFDLMDGVLGMALSPRDVKMHPRFYGLPNTDFFLGQGQQQQQPKQSDRILFFHSLAAITENAVPLRVLDNETMWEANVESSPRSFVEIGSRGTPSAAQAMDKNGNLFFGMLNPLALACWDSSTEYNQQNIKILAQNDETLQFMTGVKVVTNAVGKEELWLLTNRLQKVMTGTISTAEPNFRIFAVSVEEALGGATSCSGRSTSNFQFPSYRAGPKA